MVKLRTVIVMNDKTMESLNGNKQEVESFIEDNLGTLSRVRTINKETGDLIRELTFTS